NHPASRSWWPASPLRSARGVVQHRPVFHATGPRHWFRSSFWLSSVPPRISSRLATSTSGGRGLSGASYQLPSSLACQTSRDPSSEPDPVLAKDKSPSPVPSAFFFAVPHLAELLEYRLLVPRAIPTPVSVTEISAMPSITCPRLERS